MRYHNTWMVVEEFVKDCLSEIWSDHLGRPYHFKFYKGYLPQILLDPFLDNFTQISLRYKHSQFEYEKKFKKWDNT